MHSRAMFYVELAFHVATLMALWPLYLSQLAVFRCIPRRKRIDTKVSRADEEAGPTGETLREEGVMVKCVSAG
jgi:hypothetical protein